MGSFKKVEIKLDRERWRIQREKFLKPEEIKEERITKRLQKASLHALLQVKHTFLTELSGMKANFTIKVK